MSVWFEGRSDIPCSIGQVEEALSDLGEHYRGVISFMPGLTSVELVEQGPDSVTIRTNEGIMKRTNITRSTAAGSVVVELDEEYKAGSRVTATSHFRDEFTATGDGVTHRLVISDVDAPGLLGFLYRTFGSSNTGNAMLKAYAAYFAGPAD